MISASLNMSEFLNKVATCDFQEVIFLANQEATAAERCFYQKKRCADSQSGTDLRAYSTELKDFIVYMRYGVKSRSLKKLDLAPFKTARWNS